MAKMRHDCTVSRCYLQTVGKRLESYDHCFAAGGARGSIALSDIDGIIEINKRVLILEDKCEGDIIRQGQDILFKHITALPNKIHVLVLWHNDGGEAVSHCIYTRGKKSRKHAITTAEAHELVTEWTKIALADGFLVD